MVVGGGACIGRAGDTRIRVSIDLFCIFREDTGVMRLPSHPWF